MVNQELICFGSEKCCNVRFLVAAG